MRERTVSYLRVFSHVILVSLSIGLSVNLFIRFSEELYIQGLFALMALAMEMMKLFMLILAKADFMDESKKKTLAAISRIGVYLALAGISAIASLGFTLVSIQDQNIAAETSISSVERDSIRNEIDRIDDQIDTNMQRYEELPADWVTVSEQYMNRVDSLRSQREEKIEELRELQNNTEDVSSTQDMFILLGSVIDLDGESTMFYMMLLLVILLEISIALTTGTLKREHPVLEKESNANFLTYIDALLEGCEEWGRLNSDSVVSKNTNIPIEECKAYKDKLKSITYKGVLLLSSSKGATKLNFSKENLKKIATFHFNLSAGGKV